jgi:hypothetical protein
MAKTKYRVELLTGSKCSECDRPHERWKQQGDELGSLEEAKATVRRLVARHYGLSGIRIVEAKQTETVVERLGLEDLLSLRYAL